MSSDLGFGTSLGFQTFPTIYAKIISIKKVYKNLQRKIYNNFLRFIKKCIFHTELTSFKVQNFEKENVYLYGRLTVFCS